MKLAMIDRMVELGNRLGFFLIATADQHGTPHIAGARRAAVVAGTGFTVTEWFCPGTMANLRVNPRLAVVAWDRGYDSGYQAIGEAVEIEELAMLDGFEPGLAEANPVPQVERRILVKVEAVLAFKQQPHSDLPGE